MAVKDVIEQGYTIDEHFNHKERGYDTAIVAAPIQIAEERYICEVVLKRNKIGNRFYLHEVTAQKNLQDEAFVANLTQKSASIGDVAKILIKIATAKDWDENYAEMPSNGDTLEGEVVRNSFTDDPMDIYEYMTEDERREVADDAAENGWDFGGAVRRYVEKNGMPVSAAILHSAPIPR